MMTLTESNGPYAAIDIGTNTIRMLIAQIDARGNVQPLETLRQDVHLGHDTFTNGAIENDKTETCIKAIKNFLKVLRQYRISRDDRIRAVATSAVREAGNRTSFLDRIYMATGINVHIAEEAEVNLYTYMAVYPMLMSNPVFADKKTLIMETGAGSTQILLCQKDEVRFSRPFRFGAFRLREMLDAHDYSPTRFRRFVETQIQRILDHAGKTARLEKEDTLLVLGGDVRFAATLLHPDWNRKDLLTLSVDKLADFTKTVLDLSVDRLVKRYALSYPEAETLGPALLSYVTIAGKLSIRELLVSTLTMRDGVMLALSQPKLLSGRFGAQAVRSAGDLLKKYAADTSHGLYVNKMSLELFRQLRELHQLSDWQETLLSCASLLHDIGDTISYQQHHKHSRYLILNSDIFGLSPHDILLTALTARYHRKASPSPTHEDYSSLGLHDRIAVAQMAAILRVADALDRSHTQHIREIRAAVTPKSVIITVKQVSDLTMEQFGLKTKGDMFENVFGRTVVLKGE